MSQESNNLPKKSTVQFLPDNLSALRDAALITRDLLKQTSKEERKALFLHGFSKRYREFVDRNLFVLVGALLGISEDIANEKTNASKVANARIDITSGGAS